MIYTHIYKIYIKDSYKIYIYIYIYVCVCVCVYLYVLYISYNNKEDRIFREMCI